MSPRVALSLGLMALSMVPPPTAVGQGAEAPLRAPAEAAVPPAGAGAPPATPTTATAAAEGSALSDVDALLLELPDAVLRVERRWPWTPRRRMGVKTEDDPLLLPPDAPEEASLAPTTKGIDPRRLHPLDLRRLRALGLRGSTRAAIPLHDWPDEPAAPGTVQVAAFVDAYVELCPFGVETPVLQRSAEALVAAAVEFGVDPFLLAALARHQSACRPRSVDSWGIGLTRVNRGLHREALRGGRYRYAAPHDGSFRRAYFDAPGLRLDTRGLLQPATNARIAALSLRVFDAQCRAIDRRFNSVPHRHAVSHLIWGDHVRSALPEAQILTERRRLLGYYRERIGKQRGALSPDARLRGLRFGSPLDGAPRIVIGLLGDPRDGGRRIHYGIDLPAAIGEPVRAVADGVVSFAGAELKRRGEIAIPPERLAGIPPERLGKRGIFVRVDHEDGLRSMYVHLADYHVRSGQRVRRGDVLGTIGLSGMHTSDAHLHFGLFDGDTPLDPMRHLSPYLLTNPVPLVHPEATMRTMARRNAKLRRQRAARGRGGTRRGRPPRRRR